MGETLPRTLGLQPGPSEASKARSLSSDLAHPRFPRIDRLKSGSFCLGSLLFWRLHINFLEQDLVSQEPEFAQDGK